MLDGNPGITDLSDPYRPQKLVEMFSILYDNKWTDAYEKSDDIGGDKQICVFLLEWFKVISFVWNKYSFVLHLHYIENTSNAWKI